MNAAWPPDKRWATARVVKTDPNAAGPIVVLLPPGGGWRQTLVGQLPVRATYIVLDGIRHTGKHGQWRMPLPEWLPQLLERLRTDPRTSHRRKVLVGYSRGGRWINELALDYSYLFQGGVVFAGYPMSSDAHSCITEARRVQGNSINNKVK